MILEQQLRKILYCIYPVLLYVVIQELFILFTNQSPLLSSALAALIALIPIGYLFVHD